MTEKLNEEKNQIQEGIDSKEKEIAVLKQAIKFDQKRIKLIDEQIEYYQKQSDNEP